MIFLIEYVKIFYSNSIYDIIFGSGNGTEKCKGNKPLPELVMMIQNAIGSQGQKG